MLIRKRLIHYAYLMRLEKPIGILLLLWPTLWAIWLASAGHANRQICMIFVAGVILMRSAGCVLNDLADRNFDNQVKRTCARPLAKKELLLLEAWILAGLLSLMAFLLVLLCNLLTISLAMMGAGLVLIYPFLKRVTYLPQVGLGVAFSWGIPMAFAAETGGLENKAWLVFFTAVLWPVIYDTMYAMVDKEDDVKIGVKSTAILFNGSERWFIGLLQILFLMMLTMVGWVFVLKPIYYLAILSVGILFIYQQWLIKDRDPTKCFHAFLNNNWVGLIIFVGIVFSYFKAY